MSVVDRARLEPLYHQVERLESSAIHDGHQINTSSLVLAAWIAP